MRNLSSRDWGDRMARGQKVDSNTWGHPVSQHLRAVIKSSTKCPGNLPPFSAFNVVLFQSSKKFNTYKFKILRGGKDQRGKINLSKWRDLEKISSFPVWLNTEGRAWAASRYFPVPSNGPDCWAYEQAEQREDLLHLKAQSPNPGDRTYI